jgi:hypothetical protein
LRWHGLRCGRQRCRGTLNLKAGKFRLGSRSFSIDEGRPATVRVALTRAARRALRTRRSVHVVAKTKATSTAGWPAARPRKFTAWLRG